MSLNRGESIDIIYYFFYNSKVILHNQRVILARSRGFRVAALIVLALAFTAGCTSAMEPTLPKSVTPTDPPNTNPIIDFRKPAPGDTDNMKAITDYSKELPFVAGSLDAPKVYAAKPGSANAPMKLDAVAPLGKYCYIVLIADPPGSTRYAWYVGSRYNDLYATGFREAIELEDLSYEVDHWRAICDLGKYQPTPDETPMTESTTTIEII
jgi:hypothetical protein